MKVSGFIWDDCTYKCDYDLLKELGIDIPYIGYDKGMSCTITGLNKAAENNMQIMVTAWPFWNYFKKDPATASSTYSYNISKLLKHNALHSIYIWDEPSMDRLDEVTDLVTKTRAWQKHLGTDKKLYINLFPTYATNKQLGTDDYHKYVETFVQLSDVVSGDYFFVRNYNNKTEISTKTHFPKSEITPENLYIFLRELFDASKKYNKPLWLWMVTAQHNEFAYLDDISMRLQFNIGYIVGAELMQFWTARSAIPEEIHGGTYDYDATPILRDYTKGESFEMAKTYLHTVAPKLNEIFDKCTVIDFGKVDQNTPTISEEVPFDSGTNDIYWNKMEDGDKNKYWTVMNFNAFDTITVKVKRGYTFYNKNFKEEIVKKTEVEVTLLPGELLIIKSPYKEFDQFTESRFWQSKTLEIAEEIDEQWQIIIDTLRSKPNTYLISEDFYLMTHEMKQTLEKYKMI